MVLATPSPGEVTRLLDKACAGSRSAVDRLLPLVYEELRRLAASFLKGERPDHTLQPTALVHEAYLKLLKQESVGFRSRAQFFGVAAKVMRRILVDRARAHAAAKRGGGETRNGCPIQRVPLDDAVALFQERAIDLVALDEAMSRLAELEDRKSRVVEMRFFGGMSYEEAAQVLGVSVSTVRREWTTARTWLRAELG